MRNAGDAAIESLQMAAGKRRNLFVGAPKSLPMSIPEGYADYVALDDVALVGEDVRIAGLALHIPSLTLIPVHAVLERTVAYETIGTNGAERALCRRSQIAVRPEDVVHGTRVDPAKPWSEWRRYETREGLVPAVA